MIKEGTRIQFINHRCWPGRWAWYSHKSTRQQRFKFFVETHPNSFDIWYMPCSAYLFLCQKQELPHCQWWYLHETFPMDMEILLSIVRRVEWRVHNFSEEENNFFLVYTSPNFLTKKKRRKQVLLALQRKKKKKVGVLLGNLPCK